MDAGNILVPLQLTKMGPNDDPKAFLVTFQWVATIVWWLEKHWATHI